MAWTTPATQTNTTLVTAALWNEQITNNMQFMGAAHDHSGDAGDGVTLTIIPSGMIGMFDANCPAGWTEISAWYNKFIRGAASYGGTGGSDTHTHSGPSHTHGIVAHGHAASVHTHTGPSHTHAQNSGGDEDEYNQDEIITYGLSGNYLFDQGAAGATAMKFAGSGVSAGGTGASGSDTHDVDNAAAATSGAGTGTSGSGSTVPAYAYVIFCKKN
jgi:hypothetical protein